MSHFRVKGWVDFQHYKDRNPPWIKLHKALLDNYDWHRLQDASKVLAVCIWMIASEYEDPNAGLIDDDLEKLSFRVRMDQKKVLSAIKDLIKHSFIEHLRDASDLLAPCYQDAVPETETETETEIIKQEPKINFETLTLDHVSDWLSEKRTQGKYLTINEHALLEYFKDYCRAKNPKYKDYVAAFRNSFNWQNAPTKGKKHGKQPYTADDALADVIHQVRANSPPGPPMLRDPGHLRQEARRIENLDDGDDRGPR